MARLGQMIGGRTWTILPIRLATLIILTLITLTHLNVQNNEIVTMVKAASSPSCLKPPPHQYKLRITLLFDFLDLLMLYVA